MRKILFFALIALITASCTTKNDPKPGEIVPLVLKANMKQKVTQDNKFAFDLLKSTIAHSDKPNVFISPLSVSMALGMAWNGADNETKTEMERTLNMAGMTMDEINEYYQIMLTTLPKMDAATKLNIANSIWYKTGFPVKNDYLKVNTDYFGAEVKELDFAKAWALDTINNWCARKTNNLIKKPLDNISADAVMYLINAIYFKGVWTKKFDTKATVERNFTNEKNAQVKVNMMQQTDTFKYTIDDQAEYLDLPYGNKAFSMTVILPKEGKTTNEILRNLTLDNWNNILKNMTTQKVKVQLPRFKTQNSFELKDVLTDMGMKKAFTTEADFSKISDYRLLISRVIHSTFCEVNETGTEAAAVTIIVFETTSMPMYPEFYVNRPFVFVIREQSTGVILFAAKMGDVEKY
ncbi:MAG: serpin family protein [Paludibacter sp.]|nr:serpin family protein [Paludibacter sp.]